MNGHTSKRIQIDRKLMVHVEWIDNQHRRILFKINQLLSASENEKQRVAIGVIIKNLEELVRSHFNAEERYMILHKYKDTLVHRKHHSNFLKIIKHVKEKYLSDSLDKIYMEKIYLLAVGYWTIHIANSDKPLADFLRKYTKLFRMKKLTNSIIKALPSDEALIVT